MGTSRIAAGGGRVNARSEARTDPISEPPPSGELPTVPALPPAPKEPDLSELVGANLRRIRARRGLSLERLAKVSGVSRAMLSQVELGQSVPSINVVWKVARALHVPFSALIGTEEPVASHVLKADRAKRLTSADGSFVSRALFPFEGPRRVEFYELTIEPRGVERAEPHQAGTRENLVVSSGQLHLGVGDARYRLSTGDAILFDADTVHFYENPGDSLCRIYLVMTYANEVP